jgi:hypothetical protein
MSECAICRTQECIDNGAKHLLGCFDANYDGQGRYGCGLSGGTLYEVKEIGILLEAIQMEKVRAWPQGGLQAVPPPWIAGHPALNELFSNLGDEGFDLKDFEDQDEAASFIGAYTNYNGRRVRDLLGALLRQCGWDELVTEEDDESLAPTSWILWWDAAATDVAKRLGEHVSKTLRTA